MAELAYLLGGKHGRIESGDPEPFVRGSFRLQPPLAVVILGKRFFRANDSYGARVVPGKREPRRVPELDFIGFAVVFAGEGRIGITAGRTAESPTDTNQADSVSS